MLDYEKILESAEFILQSHLPGVTVYRDQVPRDFKRPSVLVTLGNFEMEDANWANLDISLDLELTAFPPSDPYGNSKAAERLRWLGQLQTLFATGSLPVEDGEEQRYLHVGQSHGEYGMDYVSVTVPLEYQDTRPGTDTDWPLMGQIDVNFKE